MVAERLRMDVSLSEPQRRAVLNLLLKKSVQLLDHVNALYARLIFTDDVVAALQADNSLTPAMRRCGAARARATGDEPSRLNEDTWNLVRFAGSDSEAYQVGLRGAEATVAGEPDSLDYLNTLGVAQYRNARYEQAYATLTRCDEQRRQRGEKGHALDVVVLAMTLHRLNRFEEARVMFERLKSLMSCDEWRDDEEAITLLEEAKQALEESGTKKEPLEGTEGDH